MPGGDELPRSISYIPYGEIFVEESDNKDVAPYRFNAKELDEETGLYYYGARYLDPTGAMWLSVDPLFEKYAGMSPYNYCAGNPVKLVDLHGKYIQVFNDDNSSNIERGWYVYESGSYYRQYSEENIDWENPLMPEDATSFMEKLSKSFENMSTTPTGKEICDFFSNKKNSIRFQEDNEGNYINGDGNRVFICTSKQDAIPTTQGSNPENSPLWISVGHEMAHRIDYIKRGASLCNQRNFGGEKNTEIYATHMENRMRGEAGLPLRTHYDVNNANTQILKSFDHSISVKTIDGIVNTFKFTFYQPVSKFFNTNQPIPLPYKYK